ncbi:F0F1 ATP synthase subunit epsilon [Nitrogeniibacter mangrovi]|uniref:ATP synthase epsilon chain n=1 Tax=Nitrogeniibacter mangrovi TaxID=2016596 RepID=A0A6C1B566_9RHOO|nr:F0F1 ATP synthase subunit epsilon [Nitrogeniibacter mangrovi]QID18832.1 F0F1 ATP synthase subunit epsilon [Nitrogeniibacter mangrovi]
MTGFRLTLACPRRVEHIDAVASFVGTDASGRFGILAGRTPLITVLRFGLARFRVAGAADWRYLALPGGTLHFADNALAIACRHFTLGDDAAALQAALTEGARCEDERRADLRHNLDRFEQTLMQRLWELER